MCIYIYIYTYTYTHTYTYTQKSMAGYSPWICKESDTTEVTKHAHTHTHEKSEIISHLVAIPHSVQDFLSLVPIQGLNPNICFLQ